MTASPVEILLVEDNAGDAELMREALEKGRMANNLHVARDGNEALNFLYRRGERKGTVRPDIILLDLSIPGKSGLEVLSIIKQDASLKDIPVVIFTSTTDEREIAQSYRLHANAFIIKPVDLEQFLRVVHAVENFWLSVVKLPKK